ncbi:Ankyrin-1 [Colletotrichum siamense]|nr:Ankyrin-1 [Colletotrichum siamense]
MKGPTGTLKVEFRNGVDSSGEAPISRDTDHSINDDAPYTIGWICALPLEQTAAIAMLDEIHDNIQVSKALNDCNTYTLGSIGKHNVVVACLPKGQMGTVSAATVATRMVSTFPSIKIGLLVGIGGGVPPTVRLGDVVVSTPTTNSPGVVQWDFGKTRSTDNGKATEFERIGALNKPPTCLLTAISKLESLHALRGSQIQKYLDEMGNRWPRLLPKYARSAVLHRDFLFSASYCHVGEKLEDANAQGSGCEDGHIASSFTLVGSACRSCDPKKADERNHEGDIQIHYGLVASGNQVIKDAISRDRLNKQLGGNVMCIEMEAAGLMPDFPCLVIRGICDYADSHKNSIWQEYAAASASAFAKELLSHVDSSDIHREKSIQLMIQDVKSTMSNMQEDVHRLATRFNQDEDSQALEWLKGLTPIDYGSQQSDFLRKRQYGTGEWFIRSKEYCAWVAIAGQTLFCPGIPGAGKTIMSSIVIDDIDKRFRKEHRLQIRKEVTEKITRIAGGMFLLAQLCLDSLKDQTSMREIRIALAAFEQQNGPHALDHAYDQAVGRIRSQPRNLHQLATKVICWITHAIEPLTISELQHAPAVEPGDTDLDFSGWRGADVILSVCAGLVTVDDETSIVRLIHFTTQEYFQRPSKSVQFFGDMKSFLSRVCVTYISFSAFSNIDTSKIWEFSDSIKRYPLLPYASAAWGIHAAHDAQLSDEVVEFLSDESKLEIVERMAYRYKVPFPPSDGNGLHWAAFYGILGAIDIFCGANTNELDSNRQTPLYYACQGGHTSVIQRLLQYGADPCHTSHMNSPLHAATQAGDLIGATLLLDHGGNVDSIDAKRSTPLMYAIQKNSPELVKLFLARGASVRICDQTGWTPLAYATKFGQPHTIERLLDRGASFFDMDSDGHTLIDIAAESGNIEVLKTFTNKSSNLFGRRVDGSTCLTRAVKGNKVRSVAALIQEGCDVNMTDIDGRSPLSFAVEHSDGEIVKILLENNAVINNVDRRGISPLAIALELGCPDVIEMLLSRDARLVNANVFVGWAPEFKQLGGRMTRCKRLPRGRDTSTDFCMTPLFLASALGFTEIAELLISYGAHLDTQSSDGQTAMTIASRTGLEDMIKLLIAASAKNGSGTSAQIKNDR